MLILPFSSARLWLVLVASVISLLLAGCSGQSAQGPSQDDLKAFNGANGKMPDDFRAKMQAAQQGGQSAQQQAAQAARQKAAGQPTGR